MSLKVARLSPLREKLEEAIEGGVVIPPAVEAKLERKEKKVGKIKSKK